MTGRGIISWGAVDRSRGGTETGQLIGFVTAKVVTSGDPEVQVSQKGYTSPLAQQQPLLCLRIWWQIVIADFDNYLSVLLLD